MEFDLSIAVNNIMASAIPYNPDDFEDNNPFAEPTDATVEAEPEPEAVSERDAEPETQPEAAGESTMQSETTTGYGADGRLSEEELRSLLPERFTDKYLVKFKVTNIERNKVGNPIIKFDAEVRGLPKFRQGKYVDIRRTYQEVVKFNKYLTISNLEVFVPIIPSCTTSYPTGGDDENKQLMSIWQEWFDRISNNPIVIRDDEFVYFIENDFGYSVINTNRKASVASGLVRKTLKQLAVPYDPVQELCEFRPLIKSAYLECQKLNKALDRKEKCQKQLSIQTFDLANKLGCMSQVETTHPGMKNMWEKLAKITQLQSDLLLVDSVNEMGTLGDASLNLAEDFYQIKEALTNRYLIMRELIQAEGQTKAKHTQASRIKSKVSFDPIKADEALRSLEYAQKAEESLNMQVKRISGEMLYEKDEVLKFTEEKFQKVFKNFTLNKVDHHRKILKHLENIRLDIRIVDAKGGLSRLNRDNLSSIKHNLPQSQAAGGDSWSSRTFRSLETEIEERENAQLKEKPESDEFTVDAKNAALLLGVATF